MQTRERSTLPLPVCTQRVSRQRLAVAKFLAPRYLHGDTIGRAQGEPPILSTRIVYSLRGMVFCPRGAYSLTLLAVVAKQSAACLERARQKQRSNTQGGRQLACLHWNSESLSFESYNCFIRWVLILSRKRIGESK